MEVVHRPNLFSIMIMEYSQGKPMQHKINGQRRLLASDYFAIGKLFLFDLLIRNTDRLPCRKTIPRTVAGGAIADQGMCVSLFNRFNLLLETSMRRKCWKHNARRSRRAKCNRQ